MSGAGQRARTAAVTKNAQHDAIIAAAPVVRGALDRSSVQSSQSDAREMPQSPALTRILAAVTHPGAFWIALGCASAALVVSDLFRAPTIAETTCPAAAIPAAAIIATGMVISGICAAVRLSPMAGEPTGPAAPGATREAGK